MHVEVRCRLVCEFSEPVQAIAAVLAARAPGQTIVAETLTVSTGSLLTESVEPVSGARLLRGVLANGFTLEYVASVGIAPRPAFSPAARITPWSALPVEVVPYLLPSRYCPVDQFLRFADRQFGHVAPGGARVHAILDWLHANVDYVHGVSTGTTGAAGTFIDRAGVCRDFTHLGMTLCRAAGIPARAVAVYALGLEPPDFHAVFEVFLDGDWWLVDPTRLAPTGGMVRIAHGRDAADIAFLTTSAAAIQTELTVGVAEVLGPALVKPSHNPNTVEEAVRLC